MSWFDEQIKQRKQNDDEMFAESFINIAGAVAGAKVFAALNDDRRITKDAIDEVMKYYHVKSSEVPDNIRDMNDQLEYLMRPHGIMRRSVNLERGWYKDAIGAMLGQRKDNGNIVALIPGKMSGYHYFDKESGTWQKINRKNEELFERSAISFYKALPLKKIGRKEFTKYIMDTLSLSDFVLFGVATLVVSLLGLLSPKLNSILFSYILPKGNLQVWTAMFVFMISIAVSTLLFQSVKSLLMARIQTKMDVCAEAAVMMRILSLPAEFFKKYSSGELFKRAQYLGILCELIVSTVLTVGLTSVFSLVYVTQIAAYAPTLVIPALLIIAISLIVTVVSMLLQMRTTRKIMALGAKESGLSYALISGVQKIKLSGAEKRAFARWAGIYAKEAELEYNPSMFLKINSVISTAITVIGAIVIYYLAAKSQMSVSDYYAFNTAYAMVGASFTALAGVALNIAQVSPIMEMIQPFLDAVPEVSEGKQVVSRVSGGIELNNVSFRYTEEMPNVIDNLSLKIRSGQYVAIVGTTGCGKSTLIRLMLGFETPQRGAVYFDGKDLTRIDLKSLRRKIGAVMQNGKLFGGDIFSNITISAPWLTMEDAWEAAELAGIAEDIRNMPMGMFTMVSEGAGGFSGGQKQRLMIARAIAPKPKILIFDEATSALDNITQKKVSDSLDRLKCTRIVIAHRLSTIRQCDRIIVLDKGRIAEDGDYDSLIKKNGIFADLVARQRLDQTKYVGKTTIY